MRTVVKFGGSSVADLSKMRIVAEKILQRKRQGESLVVVVSAMGKTTNGLLSLAKEAVKNPSKREMDMILATGEQVSIALLSMMLQEAGEKAVALTGYQAGILTEGLHTKNKIKDIDVRTIERYLAEEAIVVVAGFQGSNIEGEITTLGRGGSDTTAVALAAKLSCPCEIYTDVEGIYGIDPRLYEKARLLPFVTYEEMKEMAFLGAKVMEPRSVDIAKNYGVPIYVGATEGKEPGTLIGGGNQHVEERSITGLSIMDNVMMVTINHLYDVTENIARIFNALAKEEINVDMISQSPMPDHSVSLSFTASQDDKEQVLALLERLLEEVEEAELQVETDIIKVSVVGSGMRTQSGVAAKIFSLFAEGGVGFRQVSTSEISISYTMEKKHQEKAVRLIAETFEL